MFENQAGLLVVITSVFDNPVKRGIATALSRVNPKFKPVPTERGREGFAHLELDGTSGRSSTSSGSSRRSSRRWPCSLASSAKRDDALVRRGCPSAARRADRGGMCSETPEALLSAREVERIVGYCAAHVARRARMEEEDLRAEASARADPLLRAWTPTLGVRPGAYLTRSLTLALLTLAKRTLRRRKFEGVMPPTDVDRTMWRSPDAEPAPDLRVLAAQVLRCLPDRERRVMTLRFWAGADNPEIAAELGVSVGTVERDVAFAMQRMRREVREGSTASALASLARARARPHA